VKFPGPTRREADMPRQLNRRDWSYRAEAGFKNGYSETSAIPMK
jgi:hypothetical protein